MLNTAIIKTLDGALINGVERQERDKGQNITLNYLIRLFVAFYCFCINSVALASDDELVSLQIDVAYVELYSGPGIGYPVLHIVEKGESVKVIVKRTTWLKVKDKRGNEGWLPEHSLFGLSQQGHKIEQSIITGEDFLSRDYEAGVMYGDLSGANYYDLSLAYNFSNVFSGQMSVGKALGDISDSTLYEAMLVAQPFPDLIVIPYVGVGGGVIKTSPHSVLADSESRQSTLMSAAIGFKFHLARNFILRAEYKYSLALTDRDDNEEIKVWKLGFSVFF